MNDTSLEAAAVADAELVRRAQGGDSAAMKELLIRHFGYVDNLCRRMLRDAGDAEDARQDALIQAARMIATFDGRSAFRTWLHSLTRNVCLNAIRSASRRAVPLAEPVGPSRASRPSVRRSAPEASPDQYQRSAERLDLDAALAAINPVYRDALVLWFIGDFDYDQIAKTLGIPLNTVRSRLRRGKAELAGLIGEPGRTPVVSNPSTANPDPAPSGTPRTERR